MPARVHHRQEPDQLGAHLGVAAHADQRGDPLAPGPQAPREKRDAPDGLGHRDRRQLLGKVEHDRERGVADGSGLLAAEHRPAEEQEQTDEPPTEADASYRADGQGKGDTHVRGI